MDSARVLVSKAEEEDGLDRTRQAIDD